MKRSGYWLGKKRPNLFSEQWKEEQSKRLKGHWVSDKTRERMRLLNKGKTGKNHPCWKENKKRPLYQSIRMLHEYREWRNKIYQQDNYTCVLCKKRGGNMQADHFPKMFIDIIKENGIDSVEKAQVCNALWEATGRTLCLKCHRNTFNWGRSFHVKRLSEKTS